MSTTQSELRLASLLDERDTVTKLHETVVASVETNEDKLPTESQSQMILGYREKEIALDEEINALTEDVERNRRSVENSKAVRRILAGGADGVEVDGEGEVAYRTMSAYARDFILTGSGRVCSQIAAQFGNAEELQRANERLQLAKRTPANTLSSNIPGISVAQHIDQIFQVINTSRPIVASATQADLVRGTLTYPSVDTKPIVSVQSTQKTEAGNQGMAVSLKTATASTYLGGGDLSWQAINWSTPNALDLWFQLAAADYALKTEQDAAAVIMHTGHAISSAWNAASGNFADFLSAIGRAAADVWANSGRVADTVYMSMDAYWYVFGLTSTAFAQFATVSGDRVGPFRFVASRGLDAATIIAGDSQALLCAETPGAPVELRVVEPAIGGVEVGIIGAFEAVIVDPGAFTRVSSAS
jgi:hypothetical protein